MKLFQLDQKYYAILGISSHQSNQKYPFLNARTLICASLLVFSIITFAIYFVLLANSFKEFTDCVTTISTTFMVAALFGVNIWKMKRLFKFITLVENLIQKSKGI